MDLIRALVEEQTVAIDSYHDNTGDKARYGGHYYSDKAPGLAFIAAPVYWLFSFMRPFFSEHDFVVVASYVVTVLVVGAGSALLGALVYRASRRLGASPKGSVIAALGFGLGTIAFPLSTMLFSHQVAALLLFGAFYLAWRCRRRYSDLDSFWAAILCAAAAVVEFPTAPVAVIIFAYHATGAPRLRRVATFAAGLALPALLVMVYLTVAFGSPLRVGYDVLSDPASRAEMHSHGLFGVTHPRVDVLMELLFGRLRGLLPYSPVLVPAVFGFALMSAHRRERNVALAVVAYTLLFVSSYEWWQGGSSFGSRHLGPMLPFLVLPLGLVADIRPKLTAGLALVSASVMLVVTSVQPKPSERLESPFFGAILPAFMQGRIAANNICPHTGRAGGREHDQLVDSAPHDSFNLGIVLGGRGHASLLPLFAIWFSSAWGLWRTTRSEPRDGDGAGSHPEGDGQ